MEDTDRRWIASMAEAYGPGLVRAVFGPFAKDLAGRAAQMGAKRLLELAAGTGVVTARNLSMLPLPRSSRRTSVRPWSRWGKRCAPGALWRMADAMALPFSNATFDLVLCQFGVMFFPDKPGRTV